jgi:hypothetical protein
MQNTVGRASGAAGLSRFQALTGALCDQAFGRLKPQLNARRVLPCRL